MIPDLSSVVWVVETRDEAGGASYRLGRRGETWIGEWGGCVWLEATAAGERIALSTDGTVDAFFLAKMERGPVAALERRLRGQLSFHASAAASPGGSAVLVLGESGAGKSTTAAALVRDRGYALLADDVAWVDFEGERAVVPPTEDSSYLGASSTAALGLTKHADHVYWDATTKVGVPARVAAAPAALAVVAIVSWGECLSAEPLGALDAMRDILPHVSRCGVTTSSARIAEFDHLARLLGAVFVYRVTRPKRFAGLGEYLDLLTHLKPRFS